MKLCKEAREVLKIAKSLGFAIRKTESGHYQMTKPGCVAVSMAKTPSDHRAYLNTIAKLRRSAANPRNPEEHDHEHGNP